MADTIETGNFYQTFFEDLINSLDDQYQQMVGTIEEVVLEIEANSGLSDKLYKNLAKLNH